MPPRAQRPIDDPSIGLRLKFGIHTIYLLVDPLIEFSQLGEMLLEILHDRYPEGLRKELDFEELVPIPTEGDDIKIAWAVQKDPMDVEKGWKNLRVKGGETLASKQLVHTTALAFTFVEEMTPDSEIDFHVAIPPEDVYEEED